MPNAHHAVRLVAPVFGVVLAALVCAYLAWSVPGAWIKSAAPKTWDAAALAVTTGSARHDGNALVVATADSAGAAVVSLKVDLRATDYRGIAWEASGLPEGTVAQLLWRNDVRPGRMFSLDVPVAAGRPLPVVPSTDANWFGRITGIALALKLPPGAEPIRIVGVTAQPLSARDVLASRLREWTTFEPWTGSSINAQIGGADVQELPPVPLLGLALALTVAIALAVARWWPALAGAGLPAAMGGLFLACWWLVDARWEWNLIRQVRATAAQYAGKDLQAKHLAAEDGTLYAFVENAQASLPAAPARVFVAADEAYFRGRAAYHLYPHQVFHDPFSNSPPPASALRAGDFVVVWQRRGIQYDRAEQRLRWDVGPTLAAELVLADGNGAVFRIR
ncbi:MAG: hypothetical protein ABI886_18375 [Betaproteobacteria bacterium]